MDPGRGGRSWRPGTQTPGDAQSVLPGTVAGNGWQQQATAGRKPPSPCGEGQSGPTRGRSAWGARVRAAGGMGGQQAGVPPAGWVCLGSEGLAGDLAGLQPSRLWAEGTYVCQLVGVWRASEAPPGIWCACKPPANPSIQTGSRLVSHSLPPLAVTRSVLLRQRKAAASPVAAGQRASAASRCPSTYGLMLL